MARVKLHEPSITNHSPELTAPLKAYHILNSIAIAQVCRKVLKMPMHYLCFRQYLHVEPVYRPCQVPQPPFSANNTWPSSPPSGQKSQGGDAQVNGGPNHPDQHAPRNPGGSRVQEENIFEIEPRPTSCVLKYANSLLGTSINKRSPDIKVQSWGRHVRPRPFVDPGLLGHVPCRNEGA